MVAERPVRYARHVESRRFNDMLNACSSHFVDYGAHSARRAIFDA